jgi:hypothetical protein
MGCMTFTLNAFVVYGGYQGEQTFGTIAALGGVCLVASIIGGIVIL